MSRIKGVLARARSIFRSKSSESRMEEEFRFHVEMETKRLVETQQLSPNEARRRALVAFGGMDAHRESMRDERGARWFADLGADVRYALRAMRRTPGFAIAVAITLGVGIGVNGMAFGYVNSLLFRPISEHESDRLVALFGSDTKTRVASQLGYEDYLDFRDKSGVFDGLAAMRGIPLNLVVPWSSSAADMVWSELVSENFFDVLGMRPTIGRFFTAADEGQATPVAVLSYEGWMSRFAGDTAVIGRRVRINGSGFTVVGVAARGFKGLRTFGFWPEVWVPVGMYSVVIPGAPARPQGRGEGPWMVFGRMRHGMDRAQTEAGAVRFAKQLAEAYPATNAAVTSTLLPAKTGFDHPQFVRPAVLTLASALGLFASLVVLVIICANLANLQLARAAARTDEVAIRLSLGCSRGRLTRQMLVESALLAIPGVLIGGLLLTLGPGIEAAMVPHLQFRVGFGSTIDARVVAFTAGVALVSIALFGLVPALRSTRARSLSMLIGARRAATGRKQRLRSALVVGQIALSVMLLVGATLFVRSLAVARAADIGFDQRNRVVMSVNVGLQGYDSTRGRRFYDDVLVRVRELPSVVSASWTFPAPFDTYGRGMSISVDGLATRSSDGTIGISTSVADEDFINALGLRLEAGRSFTRTDSMNAPLVMVISRAMATRLWPGKNPLGLRVRREGANGPEITVVGVVADANFEPLAPPHQVRGYLPLRQNYRDWQTLIVHTRDGSPAAISAIKSALSSVDPALPVFGVTTLDRSVDNGLNAPRIAATTAGFFGALALLISTVGLYAVVAGGVAERTREIGIRVALGSTPSGVMRFVMRGGAMLGLVGLLVGLIGAVGMTRLMAALLFGLSPTDPMTFGIVPTTLALVVLVATYIPARRAVRLDPVAALRNE
jgi:predicted permease